MSWLMAEPGPALLEVMVSPETNAYPKLAFGRPITEMEPFANPISHGDLGAGPASDPCPDSSNQSPACDR